MSEIMKRKKGQMLNNNERQLILNLMSYLKGKNSGQSVSEIIREISRATGCSERTIYKIKKEASKGITVTTSKTRLRKKENKNSRNVKYDSFVKSSIRKKIHNYFLQKNSPTLNTILCLVNNDPELPNFKRSTLHTLLKEIGFVYEQKGKKSLLTESNDSVKSRQAYLRDMRRFRSENRWIIYTGETVVSLMKREIKKGVGIRSASDVVVEQRNESLNVACETVETVFINASELINGATLVYTIDSGALGNVGRGGGLKVGEGMGVIGGVASDPMRICMAEEVGDEELQESSCPLEGQTEENSSNHREKPSQELRLTVMHAGSSQGFIQDADFIALSRKRSEDAENYKHWFLEKLLPKIPPNSVVVTDNNAPYHKTEEHYPDSSWKKQQIKNWLISKSVRVDHLNQKKELLSVVSEVLPMYSTNHRVHEMAKKKGIIILSLPPFHYELNPLNMVWAQIKFYVKSNIKSFKIKKIKELIKEGFYSISQVNWMNYVHHVQEMEDLLWAVDELQDRAWDFNLSQQAFGQKDTKSQESFNNL